MTETYTFGGGTITIKPAGRGTWKWEVFHRSLVLFTEGLARSKDEARNQAERMIQRQDERAKEAASR